MGEQQHSSLSRGLPSWVQHSGQARRVRKQNSTMALPVRWAHPRNTGGAWTSTLNMLCRAMGLLAGMPASACCRLIRADSAPRGPWLHSAAPRQSARSCPAEQARAWLTCKADGAEHARTRLTCKADGAQRARTGLACKADGAEWQGSVNSGVGGWQWRRAMPRTAVKACGLPVQQCLTGPVCGLGHRRACTTQPVLANSAKTPWFTDHSRLAGWSKQCTCCCAEPGSPQRLVRQVPARQEQQRHLGHAHHSPCAFWVSRLILARLLRCLLR